MDSIEKEDKGDAMKKILIVDDVQINREVLKEALKGEYEFLEASDGKTAIEILDEQKKEISLMLLDIVMPNVSGYDVLQFMRFNGLMKHIPVILITAAESVDAEVKGLRCGARDFIRKPFIPDVVRRRVKNILELFNYQNNLEQAIEKKTESLARIDELIVSVMLCLMNDKNIETKEHIQRIRLYTKEVLNYIYEYYDDKNELTTEVINTICMASILHDVGEMFIPEQIRYKRGSFSDKEEEKLFESHTIRGCKLLEQLRDIEDDAYTKRCYDICRYHHERWDGSGFPDKLAGDDIPLCAQAVGLVHEYDDLRVIGNTHEDAFRKIVESEYHLFSPVLIETMKLVTDEFEKIYTNGMPVK
ncbi:MAG: response regulator [Christensenellaceae bacterium]